MSVDLVVHIGYPKTATSTLQDGWFEPLHREGLINLPISPRKKHTPSYYTDFIQSDRSLAGDQFSDSKLNLISDERLLLPKAHKELKAKYDISREELICPFRLADVLKDRLQKFCDHIEILITLRNQPDFINSMYVNNKYLFNLDSNLNTWEKYYSNLIESDSDEGFEAFQYGKIHETYSDIFGKENVNFLLFEQLKEDLDGFLKRFLKILELQSEDAKDVIDFVHAHKRDKNDKFYKREGVKKDNTFTNLVDKSIRSSVGRSFINCLKKLNPATFRKIQSAYYWALHYGGLLETQKVKRATPEQTRKIQQKYYETNLELIQSTHLSKSTLRQYGYLPDD